MSNRKPANPGPAPPLPERPNLEHLKKEAKQRLKAMRLSDSGATLAAAQLVTARRYGFTSWRRLVAYVTTLRDGEDQLRQPSENPPQAFLDGLEAEVKSDYKTAAAHFRQAIAERPTTIIAHYRLGLSLVRQQLYSEALDAFEGVLKFDPENLLAHYEIGKLHLSSRNYTNAIAKYQWLKTQSGNSASDSSDPSYELLPSNPRTVSLAKHPAHQAYAAELAQYLLDLIPPEIAEQDQLPAPQIVFVASKTWPKDLPKEQRGEPMHAGLRPTILNAQKAQYTEIARINRLEGDVILSVVFDVTEQITDIRVVRGLPDGLTQRAIHATQQIRFQPATRDGTLVRVVGKIEHHFRLP